MKPAHGWLMLPLLAACAAGVPQWEKPGAAQAAIDQDLQTCRVNAQMPSQPQQGPTPLSSAMPLMDSGQERDAQEAQELRRCMQDKGYSVKR